MGYFWSSAERFIKFFEVYLYNVVEQLLISMFPSILTSDFDLMFSFLFRALLDYIWGMCMVQKVQNKCLRALKYKNLEIST